MGILAGANGPDPVSPPDIHYIMCILGILIAFSYLRIQIKSNQMNELPDSRYFSFYGMIPSQVVSILDLVKNFPCAVTKRKNLRRAFSEYMEKYDPCQCAPCPNNGQPVLSGTECLCVCKAGTYGKNCEIRAPDYRSGSYSNSL